MSIYSRTVVCQKDVSRNGCIQKSNTDDRKQFKAVMRKQFSQQSSIIIVSTPTSFICQSMKNYIQVVQKRTGSMNKSTQDENVVFVEYCRSCDTHSWCTHHEEAKYHETFLKLTEMIATQHPNLEVIGNMVPPNLIPFKIAENKYIDSNTNKYVLYPQIGSFQVSFRGNLLFSKKQSNAWPNLNSISHKLSSAIDPNYQSPPKEQCNSKTPKKSQENTPSKHKKEDTFKNIDQKKTYYKDQSKGFTLTDHFKLYRPKHKHQDKDWMTEKQESEASSRRISEFGRGESRQKSDKSDDFRSVASGESKLKEMLKDRSLMMRDQGKKEMIIKLDSIEEENAYEDAMVTQRTADKNSKKKKMEELETAFSTLENKFKRFETKVKDIQNEQFDYGKEDSIGISRTKLKISNNSNLSNENKKSKVKQLPSFQNVNALPDRPSKLELYLNSTEQEKNQKLHRIYGEWKLLKQNAKKNKQMLKNRRKEEQEDISSGEEEHSQTHSNSPSNIITFKPKMNNPIQNKISSVLNGKNFKGHKFSTMERNEIQLASVTSEPKFRTDEHFYNRKLRKGKNDNDRETEESSHILRNNTNTQSVEVIRNGGRQSTSKTGISNTMSSNFSQSAKKNINRIHQRISRIQDQLNKHKEKQLPYEPPKQLESQFFNPYNKFSKSKSRSYSGASSDLSSRVLTKGNEKENKKKDARNSTRLSKASLVKSNSQAAIAKRGSKFLEAKAQYQRKGNQSGIIEQESELVDSNLVTQRSQKKQISGQKRTINSKKQTNTGNKAASKNRQISQNQPGEEESYSEEETEQRISGKQQRQSRIKHHELHDPVTFLRKQKEWKAAHPGQPLPKQLKQFSQHNDVEPNFQEITKNNQIRYSEGKEQHSKPIKVSKAKFNTVGMTDTPKKRPTEHKSSEKGGVLKQMEKPTAGRIKKNKKKEGSFFQKKSSNNSDFPQQEEQYEQRNSQNNQIDGEEAPQRQSKINTSQSGSIKRNNSKPLNYYKSEDVVFEGRKKKGESNYKKNSSVVAQSDEHNDQSEVEETERNIQSRSTQGEGNLNQSEETSNDRVEGWGVNSQEQGQMEAEENNESNEKQNEEETISAHLSRKNSIDNKLDNLDYDDKVAIVTESVEKEKMSSNNSELKQINNENREEKTEELKQDKEEEKIDVVRAETAQPDPIANKNSSKIQQTSTQNKLINIEEGKERKKQIQKLDMSIEENKGDEPVKVKKSAKQKKQKNQKKQKKDKKEKKEKKENNQISKETSTESEENLQSAIVHQYTDFLKMKIINYLCKVEPIPELQPQNNQYDDAEVKVNVMFCPSVDTIPAEEEECPVNFMDYEPKVESTIQIQEEYQSSDEEKSSDEQNEQYVEEESIQKKVSSSPQKTVKKQTSIIPVGVNIIPQISNVENKSSRMASLTKKQNLTSDNFNSDVHEDNVYYQVREASKLREIGIQKESTNEVSIQTSGLFQNTKVGDSPKNADVRILLESRTSRTENEFNDTVRNNFINDPKKSNFQKKPKRIIKRADIIEKIYSKTVRQESEKFVSVINGSDEQIVKEQGLVQKLEELYPQGTLFGEKGLEIDQIQTKLTNILKTVEILCEKSQWLITRLFEDRHGLLKNKSFGVWLCKQYEWQCFILDENVGIDQQKNPLRSVHHGHQMWFNVLEKSLALALGGYEYLQKAESSIIFTMLTGCNAISTRIKQDPDKNTKLLHLISDSLKKNYIVHAHKNYDRAKAELGRESVFYLGSVRRGEQQTLLELSQDGKESFWIKLSKFIQEFSKIDILHLRINHNFNHLDLGVCRPGQMNVIELDFFEESQGCVTLSYLKEVGSLKAYLYREEKNKVLKLVGQAKEKLKSHLFFQCNFAEGRYYVFAETEEKSARISYLGQGHPSMSITEEIKTEGLNNNMAEYMPVKQSGEERRFKRSQFDSFNDFKERKGPKMRDNFMQSQLRETFMDFVVGRSRRF